jgi:hypothetical protein
VSVGKSLSFKTVIPKVLFEHGIKAIKYVKKASNSSSNKENYMMCAAAQLTGKPPLLYNLYSSGYSCTVVGQHTRPGRPGPLQLESISRRHTRK